MPDFCLFAGGSALLACIGRTDPLTGACAVLDMAIAGVGAGRAGAGGTGGAGAGATG